MEFASVDSRVTIRVANNKPETKVAVLLTRVAEHSTPGIEESGRAAGQLHSRSSEGYELSLNWGCVQRLKPGSLCRLPAKNTKGYNDYVATN